jgi:hypothetical protein
VATRPRSTWPQRRSRRGSLSRREGTAPCRREHGSIQRPRPRGLHRPSAGTDGQLGKHPRRSLALTRPPSPRDQRSAPGRWPRPPPSPPADPGQGSDQRTRSPSVRSIRPVFGWGHPPGAGVRGASPGSGGFAFPTQQEAANVPVRPPSRCKGQETLSLDIGPARLGSAHGRTSVW